VLGPDGLPTAIHVAPTWLRDAGSEAIGDAVTEAVAAAATARADAMIQAVERGAWLAEGTGTDAAATLGDPSVGGRPRPLAHLVEDVVAMFDRADAAEAPPTRATGTAERGRVAVTVSGDGAVSCTVDPQWAVRRTAEELEDAISAALDSLRAELARPAPAPDAVTDTDQLVRDAFASLAASTPDGHTSPERSMWT
jgi:DNA-binding protein YbaB